jgi:uncharacterized membrane protein YfcA
LVGDDDVLLDMLTLLLISIAVGLIGALIGLGGASILIPILVFFGVPVKEAIACGMVAIIATSSGSAASPKKQDRVSRIFELRGSYFDEAKKQVVEYKVNKALLGGAGMFVAGVAAGMLGIGAGAFKVTVQENILKIPAKVSSATSDFIIGMTALAGVSVYFFSGFLNLTLMTPMAIGTTIGALVGGRVLNKLHGKVLRILFLVVVILIVVQMLYKGITSI